MYSDKRRSSLVYKFAFRIAIILILLLLTLIISNVYSIHILRNNTINDVKYTLQIHRNDMESSLKSVSKDLTELFQNNLDGIALYINEGSIDRYLESQQLINSMVDKITNNENLDAVFIVNASSSLVLTEFSKRIQLNDKLAFYDYIRQRGYDDLSTGSSQWMIRSINGVNYLIQVYTAYDTMFGAVVKCDTLMSIVKKSSGLPNQFVMTDESGRILSASVPSLFRLSPLPDFPSTGKRDGNYYVAESVPEFGKIASIIVSKNIFSGLAFMQWIILLLGILSIVAIFMALYQLSREIILPVLALVKATKEVERGNWDYQIPRFDGSLEFRMLFHSFTSMIKEIKNLKITSYEEKLERNKAELKYLQMQIKPHFFLNAITTISSLSYQNKNEEIRRLIQSLSKYLRYMFKGGLVQVTLQEEMEHVRNYIELQEIRFPNQIFYMLDIQSDDLKQRQIPQFLIQTFVENIFKHALNSREMLSIFIKVDRSSANMEDYVRIIIEDNGEGFPADKIEEINSPVMHEHGIGDQIGINNIKMTLRLLFKRDHLLAVSNHEPTGAKVEIRIPAASEREEGEHAVSVD